MPYYNIDPYLKHSLIFTRCFICKRVVKDTDFNENSVEEDKWRHNHTISDQLRSSFWEQAHYIGVCCVQSWAAQYMDWLQKVQGRDTETQNLKNLLFKEILRDLGREKCHVDLSNAWRKGVEKTEPRLLPVVPSERTRGKEIPFKHWKKTLLLFSGQKPGQVAQGGSGGFIPGDNAMDTALSKQLWLFSEQEAQWDGLQRCVPTSSLLWLCNSVTLGCFLIVRKSFLGAQIFSSCCKARLIV